MLNAELIGKPLLSAETQQPIIRTGGGGDMSDYVKKTTTIAGVDLQDDITQSEMQTALDVFTKSDAQTITNELNNKLDKITTSGLNRVYSITSEGQQGVFNVDDGLSNWSLVRRNGSGNVKVSTTPTNNNDATSKEYVDSNDTIKSISAGGTTLTPDADKNVNIPIAGNSVKGVVDVRTFFGNEVDAYGRLSTVKASTQEIEAKTNDYKAIVPSNLNYAVKSALSGSNHLTMTSQEKTVAQEVLGLVAISQADYDLLDPPDPNTYYFII